MIDGDPFNQWIIVPADDSPTLPPVDDEVSGLKDITSILDPSDRYISKQPALNTRGLLLGQDLSPIFRNSDLFDNAPEFYHTPHFGSSLLPPELSPDSSPASSQASYTPWLRTPRSDTPLASLDSFTPLGSDTLWDIQEVDEQETQCTGICFVDESGNSLDDPSSQLVDIRVLQEDVACTPYFLSELSLKSPITLQDPVPSPSRSLPSPILTPLQLPASTPTSSPSISPPPPPPSQTFLTPPTTLYHCQETLSPLSTLSIFSPSPSSSPRPSPGQLSRSSLSPIIPPTSPLVSQSQGDEVIDVLESTRSLRAIRGRRSVDTLTDQFAPNKGTRRKAKDLDDDDEWQPGLERIKRPKTCSSASARQRSAVVTPESQVDSSRGPQEVFTDPEVQQDNTPTNCDLCGLVFTRASDYVRHVENSSLHPGTSKLWECVYCNSKLGRKDALGRHIRSIHAGRPVVIPEGIPRSQFPNDSQETSAPRLPRRPPTKKLPKRGGRK